MSIYDKLNEEQRIAVEHKEGPLLILAGAGSGKTRVLTHRIAYLMEECGVKPWNILAITFTNKAAKEMRERVDNLIGEGAEDVWVSTFHSTCVRILRRYIDLIGYDRSFTIYDSDDQKTLMREICKYLDIDTKRTKERALLSAISAAKDELISPMQYEKECMGNYGKQVYAKAYNEYQKRLKANNALDFDDLIVKTIDLLTTHPDVLSYYQDRFQYIMVDEYQDTNTAQFKLIELLAARNHNLCVVGDDDQSIYKFRGANIYNILNFEKEYPEAKVIKLEQNYRSTQNILDAANGVIANNTERKDKKLWTANEKGDLIRFTQYETDYEEAAAIVDDIETTMKENGESYNDFAILYRTNAQSRVLEEKLVNRGIPYKLVGGVNFYARREVKDLLAYLKTIDNGMDDIAAKRIINVPKRGIGLTTIDRVTDYAIANEYSFFEALTRAEYIAGVGRALSRISSFVSMIEILRGKLDDPSYTLESLINEIIEATGYVEELQAEGTDEAKSRIENISELVNKVVTFEQEHPGGSLSEFLEDVALVADIDSLDENTEKVVLMTLHSAKGLEFPNVYMCGMEDGIFPGYMTISSEDDSEMEEERRLCYVGITRAMHRLTMSAARQRMVHGETQFNKPSRFVHEIPRFLVEVTADSLKPRYGGGTAYGSDGYGLADRGRGRFDYGSYDSGSRGYGSGGYGSAGTGSTGYGNSGSGSRGYGNAGYGSSTGRSSNVNGMSGYGVGQARKKSAIDLFADNSMIQKGFGAKPTKVTPTKEKIDSLNYGEGDTVKHTRFGAGTVTALKELPGDYEVTVEFEKGGVKKMRASFAKLEKL
ncbi:MAG: UvrD-helicase domain-containing protein [Lachnospiraceae bacterium]|nr:UvrD-helicase domain-containing protein [Lachnospiraceae bacterium]